MSDQRGKTVSVYLDLDLDQLAQQEAKTKKWSKSQVINEIVREHYQGQGLAESSYEEYEKKRKK